VVKPNIKYTYMTVEQSKHPKEWQIAGGLTESPSEARSKKKKLRTGKPKEGRNLFSSKKATSGHYLGLKARPQTQNPKLS